MSFDSWLEPPENYAPEPKYEECSECDGKGMVANPEICKEEGCDCPEMVECDRCDGNGEVEMEECDTCGHAPCSCDAQYEAWRDSRL